MRRLITDLAGRARLSRGWHLPLRAVGAHLRRGLLLYGAGISGSMHLYQQSLDESGREPDDAPRESHTWDWTIPHRWYDAAHRD